jgi:hypothetical protein
MPWVGRGLAVYESVNKCIVAEILIASSVMRTMNQRVPAAPVAAPAGNRAKVFVSYSRKDLAFAQMLIGALAERGDFDAFLDKTDLAPGEPWKERLAGLIAAADTVVFTVSPNSVASPICVWELEESARRGKRIIPVVVRRIADADAPPSLGRLDWVFCAECDDKDAALAALDTALQTDLPWVREHTRLGELARHWDEEGRSKGATLRSAALEAAERWLDRRPADANAPTNCTRISSGRAAGLRPQGNVIGSAARSPSPSSQLVSPFSPRSAAARPRRSATVPNAHSL